MATEIVLRVLLALNVVLLGATAIALLRFREQAQRFERFWDSPAGVSLADVQSLALQRAEPPKPAANPDLERNVAELSGIVRSLVRKDQAVREPAQARLPIDNAVRMARHGASIEDLIRNCGLNIGEAQLMRKLHGNARAAAATDAST